MNELITKKLMQMEKQLVDAPKRKLLGAKNWRKDIPHTGGVYAIWTKKGKPRYVGETCCLNHRCKDLEKTVNHTFRQKMAKKYGISRSKNNELNKKLSKRFLYSYLPVDFGRKELEEHLVIKWKNNIINKPLKRLLLRKIVTNAK